MTRTDKDNTEIDFRLPVSFRDANGVVLHLRLPNHGQSGQNVLPFGRAPCLNSGTIKKMEKWAGRESRGEWLRSALRSDARHWPEILRGDIAFDRRIEPCGFVLAKTYLGDSDLLILFCAAENFFVSGSKFYEQETMFRIIRVW
jgi:hypothetical protein